MLSLTITTMCKARGIKQPFPFLTANGFTHNIAHKILSGKYPQPRLAYIEKLCILLQCLPHDLLEWHPTDSQPTDIPLKVLLPKEETGFEWMTDLNKLPLEKLRELGEKMKEELESK